MAARTVLASFVHQLGVVVDDNWVGVRGISELAGTDELALEEVHVAWLYSEYTPVDALK